MKKNIMTIIIMASALMNLILTILIVLSVVPAVNKSNALVESIAYIIDLELEEEQLEGGDYSVENSEPIELSYPDKQTINLKSNSEDSKVHYGLIESVRVYLNKNAEDFDDLSNSITTKPAYILDEVKGLIGEYNYDTITKISEKDIQDEALRRIQELYKSKTIAKITFGGFLYS